MKKWKLKMTASNLYFLCVLLRKKKLSEDNDLSNLTQQKFSLCACMGKISEKGKALPELIQYRKSKHFYK